MAILIDVEGDPDFESMCSACRAVFTLFWQRDEGATVLMFCPFCGEELEVEE